MDISQALRPRRRARFGSLTIALAALGLLSGCKDEDKSAAQSANAVAERVWVATQQTMRAAAGAPKQMIFRGVRVYVQAMAQRMAVCGLVDPFADDPRIFVPFVTLVTLPDSANGTSAQYRFEQHIGTTPAEASQVYLAIVNYCYEKGGPAAGPNPGVMPMAPLPDAVADPQAKNNGPTVLPVVMAPGPPGAPAGQRGQTPQPGNPPTPGTPADQVAASGSVTMRQAGNLHTDPHGPVVRVVPSGTVLRVFGKTPDGWYQVGDTAPWGWVYESMFERH